jgi:hypothetical protein
MADAAALPLRKKYAYAGKSLCGGLARKPVWPKGQLDERPGGDAIMFPDYAVIGETLENDCCRADFCLHMPRGPRRFRCNQV